MATVTGDRQVPEPSPMTKVWEFTPAEVVRDGMQRLQSRGQVFRLSMIILGVISAVGVIAFVIGPIASGWGDRQAWTYVAVAFGYLMSTVAAAPCVSAATRLVRGHWRRPINRIAEIWAAGMIVPMVLFLFLMATVPGTKGRPSIWFGWWGSPWLWDALLMFSLTLAGYAFLYVSSIPDLAIARDKLENRRGSWIVRLAGDFYGTENQWRVIDRAQSYLGALYIVMYVGTVLVLTADFIMSLIPGYNSAIFPAYMAVSGFGGGVALTMVTATVMRLWAGADDYLGREQFFALGKLQLAFGLLWFYFMWTDFVIPWYGRQPWEVLQLKFLYFHSYVWFFVPAFLFCFVGPLFFLMWTKVRRSKIGPAIVSTGVLIGLLADRIRLYSAAFTNKNITQDRLHSLPPTYHPGVLDALILAGAIAGTIAIVMLAFRKIPVPSIWEVTAGIRLRVNKIFHNVEVMVIGKPDF